MNRDFLVAYDYGQGAVWAVIAAKSEGEIKVRFPELTVVSTPPDWLDQNAYDAIKNACYSDVSGLYVGWLKLYSEGTH